MATEVELPAWARDLRDRYLAGEASLFLLHGNTRDLYPWSGEDGIEYLDLRAFLLRFLTRSKDIVLTYNLSEGVAFAEAPMRGRFKTAVNARRQLKGQVPIDHIPHMPGEVLPLIETLVTVPTHRAAVIVDYVEMIVPMGDIAFMGDVDKANLVALQRWVTDPDLTGSDNLVVLVTENLADVHRRLSSSSRLAALQIPLPSEEERVDFVGAVQRAQDDAEMDDAALARVTAGLSLAQIRSMIMRAQQSELPISYRSVSQRKKAIIEQEMAASGVGEGQGWVGCAPRRRAH